MCAHILEKTEEGNKVGYKYASNGMQNFLKRIVKFQVPIKTRRLLASQEQLVQEVNVSC